MQWHAEWNYEGKKFSESLKTTNKAAAIRAVNRIIGRIQLGEIRHVVRRIEWNQMRDDYLAYVRFKGRAPKTVEKYEYVTLCFMEFAKSLERDVPKKVTPSDFWKFFQHMKNNGLKAKTRADRLMIVKQWFKWATLKAKPPLLTINPIAHEEIEEAESDPQPCFTPEQVCKLLEMANSDHRPIYAVMAYLGLRFGEVQELKWSDFKFSQGAFGWVTISRGGGSNETTKGRGSRRIPLKEELRRILDQLPRRDGGRLFHQAASTKYPNGDNPLSERRLIKSLKLLCKRCKFENPDQYKLHTFRHAFASMLARNNVSYKYALQFMGHQDSKILNLYYTMFDKTAEEAIKMVDFGWKSSPISSVAS